MFTYFFNGRSLSDFNCKFWRLHDFAERAGPKTSVKNPVHCTFIFVAENSSLQMFMLNQNDVSTT
jgi:hypothetical protein